MAYKANIPSVKESIRKKVFADQKICLRADYWYFAINTPAERILKTEKKYLKFFDCQRQVIDLDSEIEFYAR